ncbi:hypothetical protein K8B33_08860 [Alcanivorax sp. JB21]|uniref:DUF6901 family protein n=1 Tax=Alcanivorax limicola TaxID=2874102 RepID=UPI001CBD8CCD|nr:hypothetical protein [Alcanivorax limicola]MBZ2189206.1 hypothetical protein [Alcanivorax limicola]
MKPDFEYRITGKTGALTRIPLYLDEDTGEIHIPTAFQTPRWARLEHQQCSHCPLDPGTTPDCPVARNVAYVFSLAPLGDSFESIHLDVQTPQRTYVMDTSLQRALGALFGLVCALSKCPYMLPLRPMGLFHLPLATESETFFRAASVFLMHSYLQRETNPETRVDLSSMEEAYTNLREINRSFARRLRDIDGAEAATNAIVLLDMLTRDVTFQLEEQMPYLRRLFGLPPGH